MYVSFILVFLTLTLTVYGKFSGSSPVDPASFTICNEALLDFKYCDVTCTIYGTCFKNSKEEYVFVPLENCTKDQYCTITGCSKDPDEDPDLRCTKKSDTIGCTEEGIYPDPFDCRRSLHCSPGGEVYPCTDCGNKYYNSKNGECEGELINGQCPTSVVEVCPMTGYTALIVDNPRVYYTCILKDNKLYPLMSKCHQGEYFNTISKLCEPSGRTYVPVTDEECTASEHDN